MELLSMWLVGFWPGSIDDDLFSQGGWWGERQQ